jgi:hypothetical protein
VNLKKFWHEAKDDASQARKETDLTDKGNGHKRDAGSDDSVVRSICVRVADMTDTPVPGSQKVPCAACGAEVWAAPSTMQLLASGKVQQVVCMQCVQAESSPERAN